MKTVKEVSDQLGVSQVTVYNHIKKLNKEIKGNIKKLKGVTHINQEGIKQLEISMGISHLPTVKQDISIESIIEEISLNVKNSEPILFWVLLFYIKKSLRYRYK